MFSSDPFSVLLGGLLAGVVFGFLLQKGRVANYAVIVGQFLFTDFTVLKVMLTAILVGGVGVYAMLQLGLISALMIKPAYLLGVGVGGLVFGVGMAGLGYCPGTAVAAAGSGSRHAIWGIIGGIVGAGVYAEVYPHLTDNFLKVGDMGKVTLTDVTHISPWILLSILAAISLSAFALIGRWERRHQPETP